MIRLLLETATEVCSVAVARDGVLLAERTGDDPYLHASHLTVFIKEALARARVQGAEVEEIIVSDGPGSYTSLRVGAATAKGLCVALPGLRLRAVPTLAALALGVEDADGPVLATINSRRGEVYGQIFHIEAGTLVPPGDKPPLWSGPQNIRLTEAGWWEAICAAAGTPAPIVTGPGQARLRRALPARHDARFAAPVVCSASLLLAPAGAPTDRLLATQPRPGGRPAGALVASVDVAGYEPLYVNPPFVTKSKKKPLG